MMPHLQPRPIATEIIRIEHDVLVNVYRRWLPGAAARCRRYQDWCRARPECHRDGTPTGYDFCVMAMRNAELVELLFD
jgi:hypothetical protein